MNLHGEFPDSDSSVSILNVFRLIESLITDIQHLESEVVRTRYELSRHLSEKERNLLRSDILAGLGERYAGNPVYDAFVQEWCGGRILWIRMSGLSTFGGWPMAKGASAGKLNR